MTAVTTNKKEIIDFLWEWAEGYDDWSRLLVETIVTKEASLSNAERSQVFQYFLQSAKLVSGLPALKISRPIYTPVAKDIKLTSLTDVEGVNKLAKRQTLSFGKNLTVIYGENGSGKTGYGRILKSLGYSYDEYNSILPNIYATRQAKKATINFSLNGLPQTFLWDGNSKSDDLSSISIFNTRCVQISLSDRLLIVSPSGFHLFSLITAELQALKVELTAKIATYTIQAPWSISLNPESPQALFMLRLTSRTTKEMIDAVATFTDENAKDLEEAEKILAKINPQLIESEIRQMTLQLGELEKLTTQIGVLEQLFSKSTREAVTNLKSQIAELESRTKMGLKEVAEARGIELYNTQEFGIFLQAAESYIKKLDRPTYPETADQCVYCKQPLDGAAQALISSYRTLINDTSQAQLAEKRQLLLAAVNKISNQPFEILLTQFTFGKDGEGKAIQPTELAVFNKELGELKAKYIATDTDLMSVADYNFPVCKNILETKRSEIQQARGLQITLQNDQVNAEKETRKHILELKDRKILSGKIADILTIISNLKVIAALNSAAGDLNTTSISRKTSEARDALVKQNFNAIFKKELRAFRKSDIPVVISFATDRGSSKVTQRIESHTLSEILSEGEQKAISLAEFLTELQLDTVVAPVIFDDPVNSLDHRIIDETAKRVMELSKERQVIVFTHNILLMNSFLQQYELAPNKMLEVEFHTIKKTSTETGIIGKYEEFNSYKYYIDKLKAVLQVKNPQDEPAAAAMGYGHLRAAIEVTVEEKILCHVIRRYRKGLAFPALLRIDGVKLNDCKIALNDIYEKCCVSIDGHSSPAELHNEPNLTELQQDYDSFLEIHKQFK
jgi:hypothetical protein